MSGPYTVSHHEAAEQRVERDLSRIRELLLSVLGDTVEALLVRGRYGRGEALVVVEAGKGWPVSDYDVVVVARDPLSAVTLAPHAVKLSELLKVVRVRLTSITPGELAALEPSLLSLELKTGSQIFHGPENILDQVPAVDPALIPLEDARGLLFSRINSILECIADEDFTARLGPDDGFRIALGASEAILAAGAALLIEAGDYRATLATRLERFTLRFPSWRVLTGLLTAATELQLQGKPPDRPPIRFWMDARRFYLSTLFRITCRVHETPLYDWWDLMTYMESGAVFDLKQWLGLLLRPSRWREATHRRRQVRLDLARLATLLARSHRDRVDRDFLDHARTLLQKATGDPPPATWDEVRAFAVRIDEP